MKTCPNCHAQLDDNAIFCTACGTQFGAVPLSRMQFPLSRTQYLPSRMQYPLSLHLLLLMILMIIPLNLIPRIFQTTRFLP